MCALKFPMSQVLSSTSLEFSFCSKMWGTLVTGPTLFSARTETVTKPSWGFHTCEVRAIYISRGRL